MVKRGANMDLLDEVVLLLRERKALPDKYEDHPLTGNWAGYRDCHIQPDWLLLYRVEENVRSTPIRYFFQPLKSPQNAR